MKTLKQLAEFAQANLCSQQIILADPSWSYSDKHIRGAAENHYRTMSVDELCNDMGPIVQALAAEHAALFMWATWPTLPDALKVIDAWGFKYKNCAFDWVKTTKDGMKDAFGLGHWTRGNSEPCLLATRGKPHRVDAGVRQVLIEELEESVVFAPRGEHSAKPPEVRERIVRLMGNLPRIELFSCDEVPGWKRWGDNHRKGA